MIQGFSIEKYREANIVTIGYGLTDETKYRAYVTSPISFETSVKLDQFFESMMQGPLVTAAAAVMGIVPVLDYSRKFMYRGTTPVKFTINTVLVLKPE